MLRALVTAVHIALISAWGMGVAFGQDYPSRPVRVVTSSVGGSTDAAARLIALGIGDSMGQTFIIENRPSGVIPAETTAKAPPDGYTILVASDNLWITPLMEKTSYDPVRDFAPITRTNSSPSILVVYPSVPVTSVKELVALAKAKPGELNYGASPGAGASRIAAELFKYMAGLNIVPVPYKGGALAIEDVIAGRIQLQFATIDGGLTSQIKAGKLKALAVTSAEPTALAPGLPTIASAAGLPGYEVGTNTGVFAPAKTPAPIITRLNREIVQFLQTPAAREKFLRNGQEIIVGSPDEFAKWMKSQMSVLGKLIQDAGLRPD